MPNHVTNYLTVEGDSDRIAEFFAVAKGLNARGEERKFTFNSFVPMPSDILREGVGAREKLEWPGQNWHDWSKANWGTQWDCYRVDVRISTVEFQTAWSAPRPVLIAMSQKFPDLTITDEWIEERIESAGVLQLKSGTVLKEDSEGYQDWIDRKSQFIHPLNMRHNAEDYLEYLRDLCDQGDDSLSLYYLGHLA